MNPLQLLEDPLRAILDFLHSSVHLSYGWSIVVLTVFVRIALVPLVIKQYSSMRRMQAVAPQLKELQRKYKGNRQKLNEELMRFYKENEINPFSSCLPLVAQLPVFIALYYVLRGFANDANIGGGSVSFMWVIPDVREQLTAIGWGAFVIVAIYALSQLLSTELSATPNMPDSQRRLMRILPLVVVFFVFQFPVPSGLVLYWMTTNLWTAAQQLVMRHRIGLHLADPATLPAAAKKGSRTPAKGDVATAALVEGTSAEGDATEGASDDDGASAAPARTPRLRRRRPRAEAEPEPAEAAGAPEPDQPEEPAEAQEPVEAPEAAEAPQPAEAPEASEPAADASQDGEPVPAGRPGGAPPTGRRRQPRPRGAAKGSRPAGSSRAKKKKR